MVSESLYSQCNSKPVSFLLSPLKKTFQFIGRSEEEKTWFKTKLVLSGVWNQFYFDFSQCKNFIQNPSINWNVPDVSNVFEVMHIEGDWTKALKKS